MPEEAGPRIVIDLKAVIGVKVNWDQAVEIWSQMSEAARNDSRRQHAILMIGHKNGYL